MQFTCVSCAVPCEWSWSLLWHVPGSWREGELLLRSPRWSLFMSPGAFFLCFLSFLSFLSFLCFSQGESSQMTGLCSQAARLHSIYGFLPHPLDLPPQGFVEVLWIFRLQPLSPPLPPPCSGNFQWVPECRYREQSHSLWSTAQPPNSINPCSSAYRGVKVNLPQTQQPRTMVLVVQGLVSGFGS